MPTSNFSLSIWISRLTLEPVLPPVVVILFIAPPLEEICGNIMSRSTTLLSAPAATLLLLDFMPEASADIDCVLVCIPVLPFCWPRLAGVARLSMPVLEGFAWCLWLERRADGRLLLFGLFTILLLVFLLLASYVVESLTVLTFPLFVLRITSFLNSLKSMLSYCSSKWSSFWTVLSSKRLTRSSNRMWSFRIILKSFSNEFNLIWSSMDNSFVILKN